ncbi:MAG TPA: hypothetical protein VKG62_05330 [Solirubrobacteraceae bacterium]|nr:hypothetical protein [Solirubrobacteraceae bacterium]
MTRLVVLAIVIVFLAGFAFLTVSAVIEQGFTAGSVISIFILLLLAVGIVGALSTPRS